MHPDSRDRSGLRRGSPAGRRWDQRQLVPRPKPHRGRPEPLSDGRLLYRFKRPWRDGTTHIVLTPLELLEKLSAIVPAPKTHLVRYSGIFAPAAKWRSLIVPPEPGVESVSATDSPGPALAHHSAKESSPGDAPVSTSRHPRNYTWAELMKRVWALDVLECPRCKSDYAFSPLFTRPTRLEKFSTVSDSPPARPLWPHPSAQTVSNPNGSETHRSTGAGSVCFASFIFFALPPWPPQSARPPVRTPIPSAQRWHFSCLVIHNWAVFHLH